MLRGQNTKLLNITSGGTYSYHCALKGIHSKRLDKTKTTKTSIFSNVISCIAVKFHRRFDEIYCILLQG
jgi:hypothetical protein